MGEVEQEKQEETTAASSQWVGVPSDRLRTREQGNDEEEEEEEAFH